MNRFLLLLLVPACIILLGSCVAKKKYRSAQSSITELRRDSARLAGEIGRLQDRLSRLEASNRSANAQLENTSQQLTESQEQIQAQRERLQHLQSLIEQQQKNTEALRRKIADALTNFARVASASRPRGSRRGGRGRRPRWRPAGRPAACRRGRPGPGAARSR